MFLLYENVQNEGGNKREQGCCQQAIKGTSEIFRSLIVHAIVSRCCASKPGKPVLELCLAPRLHRGDARWKLSDNGAITHLVQIGVK